MKVKFTSDSRKTTYGKVTVAAAEILPLLRLDNFASEDDFWAMGDPDAILVTIKAPRCQYPSWVVFRRNRKNTYVTDTWPATLDVPVVSLPTYAEVLVVESLS